MAFHRNALQITILKSAIRNKFTRRGGQSIITAPLTFDPIFMERIWGGRRLERQFGTKLPSNKKIGEFWQIVDRPKNAKHCRQRTVQRQNIARTLDRSIDKRFSGKYPEPTRFPLLVKILDAHERLSLQVHPPEKVAAKLGGEPKTEFWYVAAADPGAELFVGLQEALTRAQFEEALSQERLPQYVHTIRVKTDDAMFLPAGRLHAVGEGNLLVEIQQNSDTTYRVFDWNRFDDKGKARQLHIEQALNASTSTMFDPQLVEPKGEFLVRHELFEVQKWNLNSSHVMSAARENSQLFIA